MRFVKMHGIGNDYVYVNAFAERVDDPASLARLVSPRNTGVGSDGLILVCAGAGGHAGTLSPFALVREVKQWFKGSVLLSGAISDGWRWSGPIATQRTAPFTSCPSGVSTRTSSNSVAR